MARKKRIPPNDDDQPDETQAAARAAPADAPPPGPHPDDVEGATQATDKAIFPIVGIGMSAGGLEALEAFAREAPLDSEIAFVVVQHLDPTHPSMLADLIRRCTSLPVEQVEDGMRVVPNHIYIIPPNCDMALMQGKLHLIEPVARRGLRLPIDFFFRSLAEELADKAICIILSGTGTDGTLGLREIRGAGGMVMVQDPVTAKYDGMPRSAIATDMVDYILPPEKMPQELVRYTRRFLLPHVTRPARGGIKETSAIGKIFVLLRRHTKHDFSLYRQNTILRRIERRMVIHQIEREADYLRLLQQNPLEIDVLFRELLIGVTSFFRDPGAFAVLEQQAIPQLVQRHATDQPIRVWVPGCSTGEEAYSIAILVREQLNASAQERDVRIFATDINDQAIDRARAGVYPDNIAADVTPERLQRFFVKEDHTYQVTKQIRETVIFSTQNVTKDPPFSRMDLISCRNLLIYFSQELQKSVITIFHYGLVRDGYLFLGTSESLGEFDRYFQAVDRKAKLFQRMGGVTIPRRAPDFAASRLMETSVRPLPDPVAKAPSLRELAETALLQDYAPPCVIVNEQSEILFFHGTMADYLDPAVGEASLNVVRMVRAELRMPLSVALRTAATQTRVAVHEQVHWAVGDQLRTVDVTVKPIRSSAPALPLYMVVFEERAPLNRAETDDTPIGLTNERDLRLQAAERESAAAREYLQSTVEELETANEEFRSTNEEMQSTNEELETTEEELQSVNEELLTVNSELQGKLDELTQTNDDLNNLLACVEVGIIFLDTHLNIQRFNPFVTQIINLITTDIGRPVGDIVSNMLYDDLVRDARAVLNTLIPKTVEVQTPEGRWFSMQVRPYRTANNAIVGLVLSFAEITAQKAVQDEVHLAREYAQNIIETIRESLIVLDADLRVVSASRSFYRTFHLSPATVEGQSIYAVGDRQWDIPQLHDLLDQLLAQRTAFDDYQVTHEFPTLGVRVMALNARLMFHRGHVPHLILLAIEDVTARVA